MKTLTYNQIFYLAEPAFEKSSEILLSLRKKSIVARLFAQNDFPQQFCFSIHSPFGDLHFVNLYLDSYLAWRQL